MCNNWLLLDTLAADSCNNLPVVLSDEPDGVREFIEEKIHERFGFHVMLQDCDDDEEPQLYMHSDNLDHLVYQELIALNDNGIFYLGSDEDQHDGIMNLLGYRLERAS